MEYGYKLTTAGRALLTACAALEEPLRLTRVGVGSGLVPEGTNLADVHELVSYVADGAIGERLHENDRLYLTVQYDNSANKDAPTFTLSEFIVYAAHPETGEETDLLYATLGDYRQPVPAYNASLPASVFSFPLVVIVSDEIEVSITASPGIVTHDDLQRLLNEGVIGISRSEITIPAEGWTSAADDADDEEDGDTEDAGEYALHLDLPISTITERMTPMVTIHPEYHAAAQNCNLCPSARTMAGVLRFYAKTAPTVDIKASLALIGGSGYIGVASSSGTGEIPVASATQLGGVMVGNGLNVTSEGVLSVDEATVVTDEDLVDESEVHQEVVDILSGE